MLYQRQRFKTNDVLKAEHMNHIEDGIIAMSGEAGKYTDAQCRAAFLEEMNRKARSIGMTNTTFTDPTGRGNPSTALDMARCTMYASGYEKINEIWNPINREIRFIKPDGTIRTLTADNIITRRADSNSLLDYYNVCGSKTGTLLKGTTTEDNVKITLDIHNIATICQSANKPDDFYAVVIMNNDGTDTKMSATKIVMDNVDSVSTETPPCTSACAIKLPKYNARAFGSIDVTPAYTKNADTILYPASMSKIMTLILIMDYFPNLHEKVTLQQEDITALGTKSAWYANDISVGETLTIEDLCYMLMLKSSNVGTELARRVVGERILRSRNL